MSILLIFPLLYAFILVFLYLKWIKIPFSNTTKPNQTHPRFSISLLIPFHNEEGNLPELLSQSSLYQTRHDLEIVLINDHSTDASLASAEAWKSQQKGSAFSVKVVQAHNEGKKAAITEGIAIAKGDIIVVTDADCRHAKGWLDTITAPFYEEEVKGVCAPVHLTGIGFLETFQMMEMTALTGISALGWYYQNAGMGSAANMAYRKDAFHQVGGYSDNLDLPTGDDEFLLKRLAQEYPGCIRYLKDPDSIVLTAAVPSWADLIQQRKRWASKWKRGGNTKQALSVFFMNVIFLLLFVLALTGLLSFQSLIISVGLKMLSEFLFIYQIRRDLGLNTHLWILPFYSILYPFYAVYMGIVSNFGSYHWKDRTYTT